MTSRGTSFDAGADACPFVALELDRDRRSERPDYRHRCYAEPTPAPRTIAHQERYCLSPNFSGCPIFQDWALRAAARPVPLPPSHQGRQGVPDPRASVAAAGLAGAAAAGAAGAASATSDVPAAGDAPPPPSSEPWPDSMSPTVPPPPPLGAPTNDDDLADTPAAFDEAPATRQLGAFDDESPGLPPPLVVPPRSDPPSLMETEPPPADAYASGAAGASELSAAATEPSAPVPAFLVGRSARSRNTPKIDESISREDVVPSWEIDGRFGAEAGPGPDRPGTFSRLLTIVAVVIILGLGVAAVIIVPGLLSSQPRSTVRPSVATVPSPSRSPLSTNIAGVPTASLLPTASAAQPTDEPEPTAEPTPAASPELYRIRSGDTLAKIARRNDITVAELLAANPQITNPDHIQVGQVIVIPPPSSTPAP